MTTNKDKRVSIRMTGEERMAIANRAASAGLGSSEYIRRRALLDRQGPVINTNVEELQRLYVLIRRAGGNLNQVARALNTKNHPEQLETEMQAAFASIETASNQVSTFIKDARNSI